MNWIKKFLGLNDKHQQARTQEVKELVDERRETLSGDLKALQVQAQKVHATTTKAATESAKLVMMVADTTTKIAVASGSIKLKK